MRNRTGLALLVPAATVGLVVLPVTSAFAASGTFTADATGANEVGAAGAPSGSASGTFTADDGSGQLCYDVTATGLSGVSAMHIHKGAEGANGDVVIPLDQTKIGAGETCVDADAALLTAIIADPAGYYFNVHTADLPAGAVRGQLVASGGSGSPGSVAAGTGGLVDDSAPGAPGVPLVPLLLVVGGATVTAVAARRLIRR